MEVGGVNIRTICPLIKTKSYKFCHDIESGCVKLMNRFDITDDSLADYCLLVTKHVISNLRYLKYIDHATSIKDASIESLMFLRSCAFSQQDIADLLHCNPSTVGTRIKNYRPPAHNDEDAEAIMRSVINANSDDPMESLMSKWRQLNELRYAKNDETKLKAMRLQADIEVLMQDHKERILSHERLADFIRVIEAQVVTADKWLRAEIENINLELAEIGSDKRLPYQSIAAGIRTAIESDKMLLEVSDTLNGKPIDIDTEGDDGYEDEEGI